MKTSYSFAIFVSKLWQTTLEDVDRSYFANIDITNRALALPLDTQLVCLPKY